MGKPNTNKSKDRRSKLRKDADPAAGIAADVDRQKAVRMRLEGYTFRAIADALGVSLETAYRYVNDGWERINLVTDEDREELRSMELARLDGMLKRAYPIAVKDNLLVIEVEYGVDGPVEVRKENAELQFKAMDRVLKIGKRRAELLGLNAPVKSETNVTGSALEPLEVLAQRVAAAKEKQL
jgi:hypothetical protein